MGLTPYRVRVYLDFRCGGLSRRESFFLTRRAVPRGLWRALKRELTKEEAVGLTTDPDDPRLGHGTNAEEVPQNEVYLILSEEERAKGFVRPCRDSYQHLACGGVTTMGRALSETYARQPDFYGATYCCTCHKHLPVSEFIWTADSERVGS